MERIEKANTNAIVLITLIVFILFMIIVNAYMNNQWANNNCYNTLINASSSIIERCGSYGINP